jgi:transcriptional regulator with XRE-family HTH domain
MIKNQKQASITLKRIVELKKNRDLESLKKNVQDLIKHKFIINSINELINELENELTIYKSLVDGNFHCLQPKSLADLSSVLIGARLAQKMSQKELGERLNLKEQQIQRYESDNYESASLSRVLEITEALNLKFYFEKITIFNLEEEHSFKCPSGITNDQVEALNNRFKNKFSLIIE